MAPHMNNRLYRLAVVAAPLALNQWEVAGGMVKPILAVFSVFQALTDEGSEQLAC